MVTVAEVKIWGTLAGAVLWDESEQIGRFQYDPKFLTLGWDLSPIKMPISLGSQIHAFPELRKRREFTDDTFKGLPGLLADALPDRYGNNLINAWLVKNGRPEGSMNPVEQLCFIGSRGMGALEFEPSQSQARKNTFSIEIDSLVEVAQKMLNQREAFLQNLNEEEEKTMQDILKIGTSAGGARPKAVIAYHPKTGEVRSGQTQVPQGFEHWMIKLDGVSGAQFGESLGWGRVEYAYYLMAQACGIQMSKCLLLEEGQRAHFMTRRFDREGNEKHHIQTLCGIQHYDFNDMTAYSYEHLFQTMRKLRLSYPEAEEMFRRMVFNVLATNYDDHTKNFAFRLKKGGKWELAEAYDLCFSFDPTNHWVSRQTLSVNGKRLNIDKEDLLSLAIENNIKKGEQIINHCNEVIRHWPDFASQAKVRPDLTERIQANLHVFK
ncbi:type II toxin-antitoxin system HipA family toxin [Algoriphagus namhaensis]